MGQVKIISANQYGEEICACAARISTTKGSALELFDAATDREKNRSLIGKVLASGHKSVLEHVVLSLAFCDVSAVVEEFMIEHRLASFTVKSRRYVDFSGLGFYLPPALAGESRERYAEDMEAIFGANHALLECGVPKEDARFLLPYAFHSNFYCTLNARELTHVLDDIRRGPWHEVAELRELGAELEAQLGELCPYLAPEFARPTEEAGESARRGESRPVILTAEETGRTALLQGPAAARAVIEEARALMGTAADAACERELEQLSYTFRITGITLSGLTHLARHRIQSLLVVPLPRLEPERFILPQTVAENPEALELYRAAVASACERYNAAAKDGALRPYSVYYLLSGALTDVITTMNARELKEFLRLRTCTRAQWEIRRIAIDMLALLRGELPEFFGAFGPSCYSLGRCTEGRMSCGRAAEMVERFRPAGR